MLETLYRRALPDEFVSFSSPQGREMFRLALEHGTMEGWFALAEQFHTQIEPAFCGLGSLVVALNALGIDPKRPWKGSWRWYSEEMLDCCVPLSEVRQHGVTLEELGCLAGCNGLIAEVRHADRCGVDQLKADLLAAGRGDGSVVIASYGRRQLGQTGEGHFSPIGGVDASETIALLLDVARFKYPPHWVRIERLHDAMASLDSATQRARGWVVLRRRTGGNGVLASLFCAHAGWRDVVTAFANPVEDWKSSPPSELSEALTRFAQDVPRMRPFIEWRTPSDGAHHLSVSAMLRSLRESPVGIALFDYTSEVDVAALALLVLAPRLLAQLSTASLISKTSNPALIGQLDRLTQLSAVDPALAAEIELLRLQLDSLQQNLDVSCATSCVK